MKKQYIEFRVEHQRISRIDDFYVVGGSQRYLHARFQFCEDWEGEEAYAVFSGGGKSYRQKIVDGECVVPWEVLLTKQFFVGCEAGDRITSDAARVDVRPSGAPDADPGREPSPTLQRQIDNLAAKVEKLESGSSGGSGGTVGGDSGTLPEFDKADAGKLLYVSADGSVRPLVLGDGLKIENGIIVNTAIKRIDEIELPAANWQQVDEEKYIQEFNHPMVTPTTEVTHAVDDYTIKILQDKVLTLSTKNVGGVLVVIATGAKPTMDYTIQIKLEEVVWL